MAVKERLKTFFLRMTTGLLLILALNMGFEKAGFTLAVGINPVTAATTGILGVPGVIMLYGIAGCRP